ncbi:MAG: NUDIX domain-containing protein [Patescibacteria group bacterium]
MKKKKDYSYGVIPFFVKNGEKFFLLVHHQKGHWSFPKGHPEIGEDKFQTALRELAEEVGINKVRLFRNNAFQEKYSFKENGYLIDKTVEYFLGEIEEDSVIIQEDELQGFTWCGEKETMEKLTFSEIKKVFKEALKWFKTNYR